jgi:hypothetical protein
MHNFINVYIIVWIYLGKVNDYLLVVSSFSNHKLKKFARLYNRNAFKITVKLQNRVLVQNRYFPFLQQSLFCLNDENLMQIFNEFMQIFCRHLHLRGKVEVCVS